MPVRIELMRIERKQQRDSRMQLRRERAVFRLLGSGQSSKFDDSESGSALTALKTRKSTYVGAN